MQACALQIRYRKIAHPCNKPEARSKAEANKCLEGGLEIATLDDNASRFKRESNLSFVSRRRRVFFFSSFAGGSCFEDACQTCVTPAPTARANKLITY